MSSLAELNLIERFLFDAFPRDVFKLCRLVA